MAQSPTSLPDERVPPLATGDLLTREEFERRWDLHPEIKRAELIGGMVFIDVTVSPRHSRSHSAINTWLGWYSASHPEVDAHTEVTVRLGDDDVQPDGALRWLVGGKSVVRSDALEGPPELVVEVALSSVAKDMHLKKDVYRSNAVREYLVWQVYDRRVDWWELRGTEYVPLTADEDGVIESRVFPGLRLNVVALLEGDLAAVLAAVMPGA